jgi:hypothetical protein
MLCNSIDKWLKSMSLPSVRRRGWPRFIPIVEGLENRTLLSFSAPFTLPTDVSPHGLAVADFNGDGNSDLVVTNQGFHDGTFRGVSILLGNGDGTFQTARNFDVGDNPFAVAVGDFNGDGIPDLAVTHADSLPSDLNTVRILLGNGDGTFRTAGDYQVGTDPRAIAVGDFRGDGILDLVTANSSSNTVSVLLGNGDGRFQTAVNLPVGPTPDGVAVGTFNGKLGIVTANEGDIFGNGGGVSVLLGNGDGTFQAAVNYDLGQAGSRPAARGVAVADLTGSGIADLVTANDSDNGGTVSVFLGNGDGTFRGAVDYPVVQVTGQIAISNPLAVAVGNFDGQQDVIVGNVSLFLSGRGALSQLFLLRGNGDGTLQAPVAIDSGASPVALALGHFSPDGNLDLAVANASGGDVSVLLGHGDGTFNSAPDFPAGAGAFSIAQGDFNRDGIPDLVTANFNDDTISILFGNGDGTFQEPVTYAVGHLPDSVAVADLTGSGIQDIIVTTEGPGVHGTISVLLGNGDGTFQAPITFSPSLPTFIPISVAVADFNGDGIPDLAVSYESGAGSAAILVLAGNGDGTFRQLNNLAFSNLSNPGRLAAADVNGDGSADLLLPVDSVSSGGVEILLGDGHGGFRDTGLTRTVVGGASAVAVGDFNGDGNLDLAVTNFLNNTVSVFLGNGSGLFLQGPVNYSVGGNPRSVLVAPLQGDGILDIVTASSTGNTVSVLQGNGDGTFQPEVRYLTGSGTNAVVAADFNGDGALDLATANGISNNVSVLLNQVTAATARRKAAPRSSTRLAQSVRSAAIDAFFAGARPRSVIRAGEQQPKTAARDAVLAGVRSETATLPLTALAVIDVATQPQQRKQDGAVVLDAADLADPLGDTL